MKKSPVAPEPQSADVDEFDVEANSIGRQIADKYNAGHVKVLQRLAYEISVVGLTEEEACVVVDFPIEKLRLLRAADPLIERLFKMKAMEYKRALLKTVSNHAKTDEKTASWLLEARFPDEFNRRKAGGGGPAPEDLLGAAIEFVQRSSNAAGLVSETSGKAFLLKKGPVKPLQTPHELLAGQAERIVKENKL